MEPSPTPPMAMGSRASTKAPASAFSVMASDAASAWSSVARRKMP